MDLQFSAHICHIPTKNKSHNIWRHFGPSTPTVIGVRHEEARRASCFHYTIYSEFCLFVCPDQSNFLDQ